MSFDKYTAPLVIRNSPIEFVISGPIGGRDRVLVRTESAGLDLVALSAHSVDFESGPRSIFHTFYTKLGLGGLGINTVSSLPVYDLLRDIDSRRSRVRFAWAGLSTARERIRVEDAFNRTLPDLFDAIRHKNVDHAEYSLAPLILMCSRINSERKKRTQLVRLIFLLYALFTVGLVIFELFKR